MDWPSRTGNPACVRPRKAQARKGLEKNPPSLVQALLRDYAARENGHALP